MMEPKEVKEIRKKLQRMEKRRLDKVMHEAHEKAFECIDCLDCANCCTSIPPIVNKTDSKRIAAHLKMSEGDFHHYSDPKRSGGNTGRTETLSAMLRGNYEGKRANPTQAYLRVMPPAKHAQHRRRRIPSGHSGRNCRRKQDRPPS